MRATSSRPTSSPMISRTSLVLARDGSRGRRISVGCRRLRTKLRETLGWASRPREGEDEERRPGKPAQRVVHEGNGRRIRPVQVFQHQQGRSLRAPAAHQVREGEPDMVGHGFGALSRGAQQHMARVVERRAHELAQEGRDPIDVPGRHVFGDVRAQLAPASARARSGSPAPT